jgi:hypothetical protein
MSEQFIVNLERETDNSSSDTESTRDWEVSGVDCLDSWSEGSIRAYYASLYGTRFIKL